eukprot:14550322-Alexandrium_andersonii.AAC.1
MLKAPWHSVVIGDSTLACIEAKSRPYYPTYKYVTSMATEVLRNEPSVFVEWGASLWRLTRSVLEAYGGAVKGNDENGNPVTSGEPQRVQAFLKSKSAKKDAGQPYY